MCVCVRISANEGSCRGGGGVSQKLAIAPHPSPMLDTHMDSVRLEKEEGGKPKMEDGGMPACLPPGTLMILTACMLHLLRADPFKHYQLKTDPGLPQLYGGACILSIQSIGKTTPPPSFSLHTQTRIVLYIPPCLHMCLDWSFPVTHSRPDLSFPPEAELINSNREQQCMIM